MHLRIDAVNAENPLPKNLFLGPHGRYAHCMKRLEIPTCKSNRCYLFDPSKGLANYNLKRVSWVSGDACKIDDEHTAQEVRKVFSVYDFIRETTQADDTEISEMLLEALIDTLHGSEHDKHAQARRKDRA